MIRKHTTCAIWLVIACLVSSCVLYPQHRQTPEDLSERCLPLFPDRDGWYGGDGAYSIALDSRRTLWLFGDTFVSDELGRKDRIGMEVILGNTLAVSTCSKQGVFDIHYYLKKEKNKFISFFGGKAWLWPQAPFITDKILYIPLLIVQTLPEAQPPFNFRIAGHQIARIGDYRADDPRHWEVTYLDWSDALAPGIEALAPASVVKGDHVYFFSLWRHQKGDLRFSGNILARIPIARLDAPAGHLEYLTKQKGWQKKWFPEDLQIVFPEGVSEMSVRYMAADRQWLAVYLSPENRGRRLQYRTSLQAEGPWSSPQTFETVVGEVDPSSPLYDRQTFCYAGKEHGRYAYDGHLVVTYVCNSEAGDHPDGFLRRNLFLYRPRVKVLHLEVKHPELRVPF